jgi:hypothetical protein
VENNIFPYKRVGILCKLKRYLKSNSINNIRQYGVLHMEEEEENMILFEKQSNDNELEVENRDGCNQKLFVIFIIGLLIGCTLGYALHSVIITPETPAYQKYLTSDTSDNVGVYSIQYINHGLNVWITKMIREPQKYKAMWYYENEKMETSYFYSDEELLTYINTNWEVLTENQLKWFNYMIRNVVE